MLQQGTVSLWDESADGARLRDIRGAGDMLGIERYNDAPACLHSARSETDVVLYAFPAPISRRSSSSTRMRRATWPPRAG